MLKRTRAFCLFFLGCGIALADDTMQQAASSDRQMMQDCLRKQKTADVNLSKAQMKRLCKDELKRNKDAGAMPTPPTDVPHEPATPPAP